MVLQNTLESPLDCKVIKWLNPKGYQPWIFTGRTDIEAEVLMLWPPDVKSWPTGKDPDGGKYWGQEKGVAKDEMVGWHHQINGHEFEQAAGERKDREAWPAAVHGVTKIQHNLAAEQQFFWSHVHFASFFFPSLFFALDNTYQSIIKFIDFCFCQLKNAVESLWYVLYFVYSTLEQQNLYLIVFFFSTLSNFLLMFTIVLMLSLNSLSIVIFISSWCL